MLIFALNKIYMKRILLSTTALLFGATAFAQTFTQTNEPAIGAGNTLYLVDSNVTNYAAITGTGVTWDYSAVVGYSGETRNVDVIDPSGTVNAADFPSATKAFQIENFLTNYFYSSSTERVSAGFVFEEPTFGEVKAIFDVDDEKILNYPMAQGDAFSDNFEGTLSFTLSGIPQNPACTGAVTVEYDGEGTLMLPNATTITGVSRTKLRDSIYADVGFIGEVIMLRTQYEYYDLATSGLPLFVHTSVVITQPGAAEPLTQFTLVLSSQEADYFVGLSENEVANFSIFPNPTSEIANVTFNTPGEVADIAVYNTQGKLMIQENNVSTNGTHAINVAELVAGIYMVNIDINGRTTTKRLSIK